MSEVETVLGAVPVQNLGPTLMHEHVFICTPEFARDYPEIMGWDEDERIAEAIRRLRALKAVGVDTIVDLTVLQMGRYVPRVREVNQAVDINILAATGLYTHDELPPFLQIFGPDGFVPDREPLVEMFVKDILEGIADTGVKASIIKCCTDTPGVTPGVERVLRAAARAHRETGVPISTHTDAATRRGLDQQRIFEEEGVELSRVVLGHRGDTRDLPYLTEMLHRGSFLGMDRFGMEGGNYLSFDERVDIVARLCDLGYADQLVLSHDVACWIDWLPEDLCGRGTPWDFPNWHLLHISQNVLPALTRRGVTDNQIRTMLVDNPRRIFSMPRKPY